MASKYPPLKISMERVPTGIATYYRVTFENVDLGSIDECIKLFKAIKKKSSKSMDEMWESA